MQSQRIELQAAVYVCQACRDNPGDECGDQCECRLIDELPPFGWPLPQCKCCGLALSIVTPLLPCAS
jgi:hypothetical protein